MILSKCRECKVMKHFVAYKGSDNIIIHFLCEEQSAMHYQVLPFLKIMADYCVRDRILFLRKTLVISIIIALFIVVFPIITKNWMLVSVLISITFMWCYVLLQLFLDDIDCIKVYEFCFDNSSFHLLSNMGVNNKSNRMKQLYKKRPVSIETGFLPIVYIKAAFKYLVKECSRKITLIQYLFSIHKVFDLEFVKNDDVKVMLSNDIKSVKLEINELGYKVIDLYNINN